MKKINDIFKSILVFLGGLVGFLFFLKAMIRREDRDIDSLSDENDALSRKNTLILDEISDNEDTLDIIDEDITQIKSEIENVKPEDLEDTELGDFFDKRGF